MEEPLRIAFLDSWKTNRFNGSGTAAGISTLRLALQRLGHEVDLLRPSAESNTVFRRLFFNRKLPERVRSAAPYDLVVGFDLDGFRWASVPDRGSPYVVCLKGIAADEARFARSLDERLQLRALGWLECRNAMGADRVLVPSQYSADVAKERYQISKGCLQIVPEAVDLRQWVGERSARCQVGSGRDALERPTILSVARQYPRKNTEMLIRSMQEVLTEHPDALLVVIGGGPELPRLRRLGSKLGLDRSIIFRGALRDDADVREAFFEAHVFCLPSLQEGFGIVFVEAMAAGLPIVAVRAGAVPEIVDHEGNGLLVPPGNVQALSKALNRLLRDQQLRTKLGTAGVHKAQTFDLEVVGRRFLTATQPTPSTELRIG